MVCGFDGGGFWPMVVGLWQWILVGFVVDFGSMVVWLDFVWVSR